MQTFQDSTPRCEAYNFVFMSVCRLARMTILCPQNITPSLHPGWTPHPKHKSRVLSPECGLPQTSPCQSFANLKDILLVKDKVMVARTATQNPFLGTAILTFLGMFHLNELECILVFMNILHQRCNICYIMCTFKTQTCDKYCRAKNMAAFLCMNGTSRLIKLPQRMTYY